MAQDALEYLDKKIKDAESDTSTKLSTGLHEDVNARSLICVMSDAIIGLMRQSTVHTKQDRIAFHAGIQATKQAKEYLSLVQGESRVSI